MNFTGQNAEVQKDSTESAELSLARDKYRSKVQRRLIELCLANGPTTTDAVQVEVELPTGVHASNLGLAIYGLAREHLIKMTGVRQTTRPQGTGRLLREWMIADVAAAQQWLAKSSLETAGVE